MPPIPPSSIRVAMLAALALLAACSATPPQPLQLYRLAAAAPVASAPVVPSAEVWQLVPPVRLPEYLDRDAILVPPERPEVMTAPVGDGTNRAPALRLGFDIMWVIDWSAKPEARDPRELPKTVGAYGYLDDHPIVKSRHRNHVGDGVVNRS